MNNNVQPMMLCTYKDFLFYFSIKLVLFDNINIIRILKCYCFNFGLYSIPIGFRCAWSICGLPMINKIIKRHRKSRNSRWSSLIWQKYFIRGLRRLGNPSSWSNQIHRSPVLDQIHENMIIFHPRPKVLLETKGSYRNWFLMI